VAELKLDQIRVDVSKRVVGYEERISYTEEYKGLHSVWEKKRGGEKR
jgi:hypothetical protein